MPSDNQTQKQTEQNDQDSLKSQMQGLFPLLAVGALVVVIYGFIVWFLLGNPFVGETNTFLWASVILNIILFVFVWSILVSGYVFFMRPLYTILYTAGEVLKHRKADVFEDAYAEEITRLEKDIELTLSRIENTAFLFPQLEQTAQRYLTRIEDVFETNRELEQTKKELKDSVSDLEMHKHQLELEKAKSEAIIQSLGDGLIASSRDGNIFLINKEAQEFIGCDLEEAQGKFIEQVLDVCGEGKRLACSDIPTHRALEEGRKVKEDFTYNMPDGRTVEIEDIASPIFSDGQIIGVVDLLRDVTKEREVERAQKDFVSIASHQFRTPVTSINWNAEMLKTFEDLPPSAEEAIDEIYTQNKRMNRLVRSLLNLSRINLGKLKFSIEEVNLQSLINTIYEDLQQSVKEKDLTWKVSDETDITFLNDRTLLRIVLENLITNAMKYTPEGGDVKVEARDSEEGVHFSVTDNGIGIPQDQQSQIFTRLFRAENAQDRETDGTGLGLYIAKKIVDAMQGDIRFESEEGEGTAFHVTLPRNLDQALEEGVKVDIDRGEDV
jgi:PAS domain S-box-containing protein